MDIELVVEGVADARILKDIKRTLHAVCHSACRAGEWRVFVSPSETRGEWDLGVRGPFGYHFVSLTTEAEHLPAWVGDQLRACL
jgi:hypothetical protein